MPDLVKNTKPLQCPRCAFVSHQRYNVFRLAALLNHYQGGHGYIIRSAAYNRMSDEVCRRKREE